MKSEYGHNYRNWNPDIKKYLIKNNVNYFYYLIRQII